MLALAGLLVKLAGVSSKVPENDLSVLITPTKD